MCSLFRVVVFRLLLITVIVFPTILGDNKVKFRPISLPEKKSTTLISPSRTPHLLLWTVYEPPAVVLDLLQLVKLHGDVIDGELQQVPEASQVLRGGPRHGTGVLRDIRERILGHLEKFRF